MGNGSSRRIAKSDLQDFKEKQLEKRMEFFTQVIVGAIPIYIIVFIYRSMNNYTDPGDSAFDAVGETALNTLFWFVIVIPIILLIRKYFFDSELKEYERQDKKRQQFLNSLEEQMQERERVIIEKVTGLLNQNKVSPTFPFTSEVSENRSNILNVLDGEISPTELRLSGKKQEIFLKTKLDEFKNLRLPQIFGNDSDVEIDRLDSVYNGLFEPLFRQWIRKQDIPIELLEVRNELIRKYNDKIDQILDKYQKDLNGISSGNRGEERVNKELEYFSDFSDSLSNVRIEYQGDSVETDNILLSNKGVFLFEVKNFAEKGNFSIRITKDGQWQRVYQDGKIVAMEKDVTAQHNRHIYLKSRFIKEQWKLKYGVEIPAFNLNPVIVIANDTVMMDNQTDLPIIRISQIYHHIQKFNENIPQDTLSKLKEIIIENQLPLKTYPLPDFTNGLEAFKRTLVLLEEFDKEMAQFLKGIFHEAMKERTA